MRYNQDILIVVRFIIIFWMNMAIAIAWDVSSFFFDTPIFKPIICWFFPHDIPIASPLYHHKHGWFYTSNMGVILSMIPCYIYISYILLYTICVYIYRYIPCNIYTHTHIYKYIFIYIPCNIYCIRVYIYIIVSWFICIYIIYICTISCHPLYFLPVFHRRMKWPTS